MPVVRGFCRATHMSRCSRTLRAFERIMRPNYVPRRERWRSPAVIDRRAILTGRYMPLSFTMVSDNHGSTLVVALRVLDCAAAVGLGEPESGVNVGNWQCASKARIISGGRIHPESC
jgi:hypothetical protein